MFKNFTLKTTTILASTVLATAAYAESGATEILEEYFATIEGGKFSVNVGDKDDALRYTQWNNVIVSTTGDDFQLAIPFVRIDKGLLGGYEMSFAPMVKGAFQSPDPKIVEPVEFAVENKGAKIKIDGASGSRSYETSFDSISVLTLPHPALNMQMSLMNGKSSQSIVDNGYEQMLADFDIASIALSYEFKIDGQNITGSTNFDGLSGSYDFPNFANLDMSNPAESFDINQNMLLSYAVKGGSGKTSVDSPLGPVTLDATFGSSTGTVGSTDSFVTLFGDANDINYSMNLTGMGMPPMDFSLKRAELNMTSPIDNVDVAKDAKFKFALAEVTVSDTIWAMFDPTGALPRDAVSIDIDLDAKVRWLKKIADLAFGDSDEIPMLADSANINSVYIKAAGAEVDANGAFTIDNSSFPPVPQGKVNASVKGSQALVEKLTRIGLLPPQSVMMSKGISAMFFVPGGGADHLKTEVIFSKDGSITANGMKVQ